MKIVKCSPSSFTVQCPPEVIEDVITVLEKLAALAQDGKRRMSHALALDRARDPALSRARQAKFEERAREVYQEYKKHRSNGTPEHAEALKKTRAALVLGSYETELYVSHCRKLERAEMYDAVRQELEGGMSTREAVEFYGLSPSTVRRIKRGDM